EGAESAYNIPAALRMRGRIDAGRLATALTRLVERHAALRTTFIPVEGEPMQWVGEPARVELPVTTVEPVAGVDPVQAVRASMAELALRPFNLETGPLLRAHLYSLSETDHILAV